MISFLPQTVAKSSNSTKRNVKLNSNQLASKPLTPVAKIYILYLSCHLLQSKKSIIIIPYIPLPKQYSTPKPNKNRIPNRIFVRLEAFTRKTPIKIHVFHVPVISPATELTSHIFFKWLPEKKNQSNKNKGRAFSLMYNIKTSDYIKDSIYSSVAI